MDNFLEAKKIEMKDLKAKNRDLNHSINQNEMLLEDLSGLLLRAEDQKKEDDYEISYLKNEIDEQSQ